MKKNYLFAADSPVYPGGYVPLLAENEIQEELKNHAADMVLDLPVKVIELADIYRVEVELPGMKREEFFIRADENIITVCVLHKHEEKHVLKPLDEAAFRCVDQHIELPQNADTTFITAEYRTGILRMHVSKSTRPLKNHHAKIVVY